jgi:DNA-binding IclR family transcriptional regulator
MTLREQILELLGEGPETANGLSKALRVDKSSVKRLLLCLERKGLVTCQQKTRGKVVYKFWRLWLGGASSDPDWLKNRRG